jgi:Ca2+/Na+ antiporter
MGISNSLGANTLAILFSLSIPWFIKSMMLQGQGEQGFIEINSSGMTYIITSLILVVLTLYLILFFNTFQLKMTTGLFALSAYSFFVTMAVLVEAGVFAPTVLPIC